MLLPLLFYCSFSSFPTHICCVLQAPSNRLRAAQLPALSGSFALPKRRTAGKKKKRSVSLRTPWAVRSCSKISCPCKNNITSTGQDTASESWTASPRMGRGEKQPDVNSPALPRCVAEHCWDSALTTCLCYSLKSVIQNYSVV